MGIKGLRAALGKNQLRSGHVKEFRSQTLAVDGFSWLHRGAFSCALELATGQATTRHIDYCLHLVRMLQHNGVTPIVVLDGAALPGKAVVNTERRHQRQSNLSRAQELMDEGKRHEAESFFQKAISITPEMANQLHRTLLDQGVECIVAPFEADAQMAYLVKIGRATGVITEDSDMLPYGIDTVIYKMDKYGECVILDASSIRGLNGEEPKLRLPEDPVKRLHVCILAGCDYLPSVQGIGIIKALALVNKWNTGPRAIAALKNDTKRNVPDDYEKLFRQAELIFKHHWVFDPATASLVHLNPLPANRQPRTQDDEAVSDLTSAKDAGSERESFRTRMANSQKQDLQQDLEHADEYLGVPLQGKAELAREVCSEGLLHVCTLAPFPQWQPASGPAGARGRGGVHQAHSFVKPTSSAPPTRPLDPYCSSASLAKESGCVKFGGARGVAAEGSSRGGRSGGSGGSVERKGGMRMFLSTRKDNSAEKAKRARADTDRYLSGAGLQARSATNATESSLSAQLRAHANKACSTTISSTPATPHHSRAVQNSKGSLLNWMESIENGDSRASESGCEKRMAGARSEESRPTPTPTAAAPPAVISKTAPTPATAKRKIGQLDSYFFTAKERSVGLEFAGADGAGVELDEGRDDLSRQTVGADKGPQSVDVDDLLEAFNHESTTLLSANRRMTRVGEQSRAGTSLMQKHSDLKSASRAGHGCKAAPKHPQTLPTAGRKRARGRGARGGHGVASMHRYLVHEIRESP